MSYIGINLLHQLADAGERTAPDRLLGNQRKPALDLVEPGRVGGSVVDVVSRALREPSADSGMFVGGVIVNDQMDFEIRRDVLVKTAQEGKKPLMAMTGFAFCENRATRYVEGGEQIGRAVSNVIARHSLDVPSPIGSAGWVRSSA